MAALRKGVQVREWGPRILLLEQAKFLGWDTGGHAEGRVGPILGMRREGWDPRVCGRFGG
jgi:hypothetical protein